MEERGNIPTDIPSPDDTAELDHDADRYADIVCANCVTTNGAFDHFCVKCGMPLTAYATIGPLEQVYTLGHGYREATSRPTRPIILAGLWLIFGPQIPLLLFVMYQQVVELLAGGQASPNGPFAVTPPSDADAQPNLVFIEPAVDGSELFSQLFGLAAVTALTFIYCMMLYKVTSRYFASTPEDAGSQMEDEADVPNTGD